MIVEWGVVDWHRFIPTVLTTKKKQPGKKVSEEEIDAIVEAQAADNSAWGKPIQVRKGKTESPGVFRRVASS